jgi:hypothetical protein
LLDNPALLAAFRSGDSHALRDVYVRNVDKVDSLIKQGFVTLGPPPMRVPGVVGEGRRDIVQDVFLRAFRESARLAYDGLRPYAPYLLRIAKNVCIDRYRRTKRERLHTEAELLDIDAILAERAPPPESNAEEDGDFRARRPRTHLCTGAQPRSAKIRCAAFPRRALTNGGGCAHGDYAQACSHAGERRSCGPAQTLGQARSRAMTCGPNHPFARIQLQRERT